MNPEEILRLSPERAKRKLKKTNLRTDTRAVLRPKDNDPLGMRADSKARLKEADNQAYNNTHEKFEMCSGLS